MRRRPKPQRSRPRRRGGDTPAGSCSGSAAGSAAGSSGGAASGSFQATVSGSSRRRRSRRGTADTRRRGPVSNSGSGTGSDAARSGSYPGSGGMTRVSSDSKCHGWRSASASSRCCSSSNAPTAGRSPDNMEGSKTSSWASQSLSSSRQVGGATADSSPLLRSRMAGTCPVGVSFQCGRSGWLSSTGPVTSRTESPAGSAPMMRTRPE